MKNEDYITILGWMSNELKLSGNELMAYAVIYGFTKDGVTEYKGSSRYLSEALNVSKNTAVNTLNSLTEKSLIIKKTEEISGVVFNRYYANLDLVRVFNNCTGVYQNLVGGIPKIGTSNNKENNNGNNKEIDISSLHSDISKENPPKRFKKPTIEEVAAYCRERKNSIDPEAFVAYYESKGWMVGRSPMKDWKQAVITFEKNQKKYGNGSAGKNGNNLDPHRKLEW